MEKITIEMKCILCGKPHKVENIDKNAFLAWREYGALIQKALPKLSATEREQLISELCPECQEKIFM